MRALRLTGLLSAFVGVAALAGDVSLLDALESGDRETAIKLVDSGVDVNARSSDGTTALMWAAYHDDVELVRRLIDAGADAAAQNEYGASALSEGAILGSTP